MATIGEPVMARPKGRPKKPGGEGTQVRIDTDLATKARYLASQRGMKVSAFLSELLRPVVEREFRKAGKAIEES